ncbi:unnamed protein product [Linum trigynum]|uniref:Uncharacterized protein n=1 Tax=Linum trigynum TaxID=586398 RepID=A0AAV2DAL1_9ROSI
MLEFYNTFCHSKKWHAYEAGVVTFRLRGQHHSLSYNEFTATLCLDPDDQLQVEPTILQVDCSLLRVDLPAAARRGYLSTQPDQG